MNWTIIRFANYVEDYNFKEFVNMAQEMKEELYRRFSEGYTLARDHEMHDAISFSEFLGKRKIDKFSTLPNCEQYEFYFQWARIYQTGLAKKE